MPQRCPSNDSEQTCLRLQLNVLHRRCLSDHQRPQERQLGELGEGSEYHVALPVQDTKKQRTHVGGSTPLYHIGQRVIRRQRAHSEGLGPFARMLFHGPSHGLPPSFLHPHISNAAERSKLLLLTQVRHTHRIYADQITVAPVCDLNDAAPKHVCS